MALRLKNVAIVGGGVAGLLSLRHILKYPHLRPTLFEATGKIGGVWVYDGKENGYDEYDHQITPISVYRNLISNQSKQIMEFRDFKHLDSSIPTFLHHEYVLDYLRRFACKFQLNRYIHLNHRVRSIAPYFCEMNKLLQWKIQVSNHEVFYRTFDAVVVCNGHFASPNIPKIQGLDYFKGLMMHSRYYRNSEDFYNKTVLVIGAGISGLDITLDIAQASTKSIYVSNRGEPFLCQLPAKVYEVPEVSHFNKDGHSVTLINGKTISVNAVIFATGFFFRYPFLHESCGIDVFKNRVSPLFKHIVNIHHPSMLFLGIPNWTPQFQMMYFQAVYISKLLANEISLPTVNEMLLDQSHDFMSRINQGWPHDKAHNMYGISLEYVDYLADACCIDRMPDYLKNIYNHVVKARRQDVINFKHDTYCLEDFE